MVFYRRTYLYIISSCDIIIIRVVHSFLHYNLWRNYLYVKCKHKGVKHVLRSRRVKRGFCSIIPYNRISIILQIEDTCIKPEQVSRGRTTVCIYTIFICDRTIKKVTFNSLTTLYMFNRPIYPITRRCLDCTILSARSCNFHFITSCFIGPYSNFITSQIRFTF